MLSWTLKEGLKEDHFTGHCFYSLLTRLKMWTCTRSALLVEAPRAYDVSFTRSTISILSTTSLSPRNTGDAEMELGKFRSLIEEEINYVQIISDDSSDLMSGVLKAIRAVTNRGSNFCRMKLTFLISP
eukprot:Blabericola_migrator_1__6840@NODE_3465_length_1749_cov_81_727111_g2155_i0_p2_GENE_NODE_3465_length_1749_cov_81_727111_g2155_i0NODE_3465_length_1749_cov_81_727111_g2155_i0_p2_ORF_typecomplete_len128_score12_03_NODE_3465_length_1749_cov_81_727111_g2155_i09231306